ncbi:MAG: hypothetical protein IIU36_05360 [Firmicutes bacterium]|nr:hypothetical protein [Bacillota bacterium]
MSKFVFDNSPGIKILTEEQVKKIHEEAHKYALEKLAELRAQGHIGNIGEKIHN